MSLSGYENGCINSAANWIAYKSFPLFFYVPQLLTTPSPLRRKYERITVCKLLLDLPEQMFQTLQQMQHNASKLNSKTDPSVELKKIAAHKGFMISENQGSGNCMFYALSEQLDLVKRIKISHKELRQSIVQYLRKNPQMVSLVLVNAV